MSDSEESVHESPPHKKKKIPYQQKYKTDWEKEWKWVKSSEKGPLYAW